MRSYAVVSTLLGAMDLPKQRREMGQFPSSVDVNGLMRSMPGTSAEASQLRALILQIWVSGEGR